MQRYSEAINTDIRKRMRPPARKSVARIPEETGKRRPCEWCNSFCRAVCREAKGESGRPRSAAQAGRHGGGPPALRA